MGFLSDYKKMKKKIEKNQKKIDKLFGTKPNKNTNPGIGTEPAKHEYVDKQRKSKLVKVPKGAIEKLSELDNKWYKQLEYEIEDSVRVYYPADDEITVGYLPSAITEFMEEHDDGQTSIEVDPDDLSVTITYLD